LKQAKAVYNGKSKYAKEGCRCRICKKWLKKGMRKANQFLCCNKDSRDLTRCQKIYYKRKRARIAKLKPKPDHGFVICDVCQTKIKKTDPFQKRCTSGKKGVLSSCQKEGMRRNSNSNKKFDDDLLDVPTKKRLCLKCGDKFDSLHRFNCLCDKCTVSNDRGVRTEHRVHSPVNHTGGKVTLGIDDVDLV
jgi:hypothetical protein